MTMPHPPPNPLVENQGKMPHNPPMIKYNPLLTMRQGVDNSPLGSSPKMRDKNNLRPHLQVVGRLWINS